MVRLEEKYNLNHFYRLVPDIPVISSGDSQQVDTTTNSYEFYEKSLALTSDLKRVPILRAIHASWSPAAGWVQSIGGTGAVEWNGQVIMYNAPNADQDPDEILGEWEFDFTIVAGSPDVAKTIWGDDEGYVFQGGILLNDTVSFKTSAATDGTNVSGDLTPLAEVILVLEVDWVKLTKAQMNEFIQEHLFARRD
jgi:hypothetical protein